MRHYKIIIIDDENLALDILENYISRYPNLELIGRFNKPTEALLFLNSNEVDLVFSDINMPHLLGTELMRLSNNTTKFIMVTSYSEYAIESFELDVIDYLLKPVSFERFSKSITKFEHYNKTTESSNKSSFFIKEGSEYVKILIKDIDYIEGLKDYAKIYVNGEFHLALKTLKSIQHFLEIHNFIRVHKSYIIPLYKIEHFTGKDVIINKNRIPVGSNYREKLIDYLNSHKL
ncbi:MAG: LytTR family DNA-binding domain-containing protein [Marinifilaceae bacterium]